MTTTHTSSLIEVSNMKKRKNFVVDVYNKSAVAWSPKTYCDSELEAMEYFSSYRERGLRVRVRDRRIDKSGKVLIESET